MKLIKTSDAVGHVLCHDITQIVKDVKKDVLFKKGHIVRKEDIPLLLSVGKENLYIWEKSEGMLHENEAAEILFDICKNEYMISSEIKEGKISIFAEIDGFFKIKNDKLFEINNLGEMIIATRQGNTMVKKGDELAGTRIISLLIEEEKMKRAKALAGHEPLLKILPFKHKKIGIVTTGSEILKGLIKDTFAQVLIDKFSEFDTEIIGQKVVGDEKSNITKAIIEFIEDGADIVACTGGMSVDPDDNTPGAIKDTGAEIITYGAPVLPGAMMLVSYYNYKGKKVTIVGLPGCVMYSKRTVFDLLLPRIMADDTIAKEDIAKLGAGGLCLNCKVCTFPNCGFGSHS